MRAKMKKFRVEGYQDGERFGDAGVRADHVRIVSAVDAEAAESKAAGIWESQGVKPELIVATEWRTFGLKSGPAPFLVRGTVIPENRPEGRR